MFLVISSLFPLVFRHPVRVQLITFEGHTSNVTTVGFQKDSKWIYSSSEDGSVKIWDLRTPGFQRDYESRAPVNTVALHPNQAELVSGDQKGNIRVWDLTTNTCSCELVRFRALRACVPPR